jgi:hypothetical protein
MVEGCLKSCSTEMGDGDCTLGNASKMSQSKAISFLDDGEMESSEPGVIVHHKKEGRSED